MRRYINRFTVIMFSLLGLVLVVMIVNFDPGPALERARDAAPDMPDEIGTFWEPAWQWVMNNYVFAIVIALVILLPATRQLLVSTIIVVGPVALILWLGYGLLTHEDLPYVSYNSVDALFDWMFGRFLPENYEP